MRDLRVKTKNKPKKETFKDGKRFIDGKRKEVRFSTTKNCSYDLECREGDYDLFFALSNKWETHSGLWVTGVSEPYRTKLHD